MKQNCSMRLVWLFVACGIILAARCMTAQPALPITVTPGQTVHCAVNVGAPAVMHVGIRNSATRSLRIWSATLDSPSPQTFSIASDLSRLMVRIQPGEQAFVAVEFQPSVEGRYSATLRVRYDVEEMDSLDISFDCLAFNSDKALLHLLPRMWEPPTAFVGDFSGTLFELENSGAMDKRAASIEISGPDSAEFYFDPQPALDVPASSRTIGSLRCRSNTAGIKYAMVRITYDDTLTDHTLLAVAHIDRRAELVAGNIFSFKEVMLAEHRTLSTSLRNAGNVTLVIDKHEISGTAAGDFSADFTNPFSIEPGQSRSLDIHFAPQALGRRDAVLRLFSNDAGHPEHEITLTGDGTQNTWPSIVLGKSKIQFPALTYVDSVDYEDLPIHNTGLSPLRVSQITNQDSGMPFHHECELTFSPSPPFMVNARDSIILRIGFAPKSNYFGASLITLHSDDRLNPEVSAIVNGHSVHASELAVSPNSLVFPVVVPGDSLDAVVTLWNRGHYLSGLRLYSDTIIGPDADHFSVVHRTYRQDAVSTPVEIGVRYRQSGTGSHAAFLRLITNDPARRTFDIPLIGYISGSTKSDDVLSPHSLTLSHFPNPAATLATVSWTTPNGGEFMLLLRDSRGAVIREFRIYGDPLRTMTQTLDVSGLPQGIYFYTVIGWNHVATRAMTIFR